MKSDLCMEYHALSHEMSASSVSQDNFGHDHHPLLNHDSDFKEPGEAGHFCSDVGYIVHTPSPPPPPPSIICYCSSCCSTSRRNLSPRNRISITSCSSSPSQALRDRWCNSLYVTTGCCRCRHPDYTAIANKSNYYNLCCSRKAAHTPHHQHLYPDHFSYYLNEDKVCYEDQVTEEGGDRIVWEFKQVTINRVPGYGFGIAVSGGKDNPHFANGDPSIAVSDVLKAGPAEGKLLVNDRITSVNGISLENVEYGEAVQVLRDSGASVVLSIRRRLLIPSTESRVVGVQLNKRNRKDDFGIQLANLIYIKSLPVSNSKLETISGSVLQEGDVVLKINNQSVENLSLKEVKKLIDNNKEKLQLTIRRNTIPTPYSTNYAYNNKLTKDINYLDPAKSNLYGIRQNLYVQPPCKSYNSLECEKNKLVPRNPQSSDVRSLLPNLNSRQESCENAMPRMPNFISSHNINDSSPSQSHFRSCSLIEKFPEPPRPPPPRPEDYYNFSSSSSSVCKPTFAIEDPRFIAFQKEDSLGVRLIGGNECGIFVTAVQASSAADSQGLQCGDKILKANDVDMTDLTREEAVLYLTSVKNQVNLIVQNRKDDYEHVLTKRLGDSFYIKTHFDHDLPSKGEMSFRKGDVFHVTDSLYNDQLGSWLVYRMGRNNQEVQKGVIPNKARVEELATAQYNATKKELISGESRIGFFRRKRNHARRSKSLSKDHWDDVVFGKAISKFPPYERVILKHPGFIRPVVLFGPVSDIAREKLLQNFPEKFSAPQLENPSEGVSKKANGIIRLSAVRTIMDAGRHALLDVTPNAVDRLNYAQFYPIVVLLRADSKQIVKELRQGVSKCNQKSNRKLFEQCQKLEKEWSHIFTASVSLSTSDLWFRKLINLINKYQRSSVWVSESLPEESFNDDFLFPMSTTRSSCTSPPDSDKEEDNDSPNTFGTALPPALSKYSSDPSLVTQDDALSLRNAPPPYTSTYSEKVYGMMSLDNYSPSQEIAECGPDIPNIINLPLHSESDRLCHQNSSVQSIVEATPYQSSLGRHHTITHKSLRPSNSCDDVCVRDTVNHPHMYLSATHNDIKTHFGRRIDDRERAIHDPYRYTRFTQQPMEHKHQHKNQLLYSQHRAPEANNYIAKPSQPPKHSHSYKPEPPPKPKFFAQTYFAASNTENVNSLQHAKSFSIEDTASNNCSNQFSNGTTSSMSSKYSIDNSDSNGFDSGHGSSLDCSSTFDRRSLYSSNRVSPKPQAELNGLNLDYNNEERNSAFEIYKKPRDRKHLHNINNGHYTIR